MPDAYPQIKAKYNLDNFDVVIKALEQHFGDLFILKSIENALKKNLKSCAYLHLFDLCMKSFTGLYTTDEIAKKLCKQVNDPNSVIQQLLLKNFIFIPPHEHGVASHK